MLERKEVIMDKKEFKKILGVSFSFGLVALGLYNLYWFVCYFRHGRDTSVIPPNTHLFYSDLAVMAVTIAIITVLELAARMLRRKKHDDGSGSENR